MEEQFRSVKELVKSVSDDEQFNESVFDAIDRKHNMEELKKRIKKAGLSIKEVSKRLKIPYSTLNSYLNEFNPIPEYIMEKIEVIIEEVSTL